MYPIKKILLIFLLSTPVIAVSRTAEPLQPNFYEGDAVAGAHRLRMQFIVQKDPSGNFSAKMNVPAQGTFDYPATVGYEQDSVVFRVEKPADAYFKGKIKADSIVGEWHNYGKKFPLTLRKSVDRIKLRPQYPQPPFPYAEQDVIYYNGDSSIRYGATLTLPEKGERFPVALLITGSGRQDRNETLFDHQPFRVIADYLGRRGIAVLRVDDRGCGQTTGDLRQATSEDFARDVLEGVRYLKNRPEIDPAKIGLAGHSEGGLIALIAAQDNPDIAFIVSLAGPGVPGIEIFLSQQEHALKKIIQDQTTIDLSQSLNRIIFSDLIANPQQKAEVIYSRRLKEWVSGQDSNTVKKMMPTFKSEQDLEPDSLTKAVGRMNLPWYRYFMASDPGKLIGQIRCPMLILNGEKDMQVYCDLNMDGLEKSCREAGKTNVEFRRFPGLNHLFQHCETGEPDEYGSIDETFAPEALDLIAEWIGKTTGSSH